MRFRRFTFTIANLDRKTRSHRLLAISKTGFEYGYQGAFVIDYFMEQFRLAREFIDRVSAVTRSMASVIAKFMAYAIAMITRTAIDMSNPFVGTEVVN